MEKLQNDSSTLLDDNKKGKRKDNSEHPVDEVFRQCDTEIVTKSTTVQVSGSGPSIARQIIAEEMGVGVSDIADTADLAELGMDSLMSLTILGTLREQTGVDLPSTFLVTNANIEDVENALGMRAKPAAQVEAAPRPRPSAPKAKKAPQLTEVNAKLQDVKKIDISKLLPATSVLLQGNAKTATKKFFLLPDGSGSATSYITIPNLSPTMAAYGLNCPYMKKPTELNCGIDGLTALYVAEIKRRQPKGPYLIG